MSFSLLLQDFVTLPERDNISDDCSGACIFNYKHIFQLAVLLPRLIFIVKLPARTFSYRASIKNIFHLVPLTNRIFFQFFRVGQPGKCQVFILPPGNVIGKLFSQWLCTYRWIHREEMPANLLVFGLLRMGTLISACK